jgi:hypothetical protein
MSVEPGGYLKKDPNADLPYVFQWEDWLGDGVTIAEAEFDVTGPDDALETHDDELIDSSRNAQVWLSGGTADADYVLRCRVTTNETPARVDDRSITIRVRER